MFSSALVRLFVCLYDYAKKLLNRFSKSQSKDGIWAKEEAIGF